MRCLLGCHFLLKQVLWIFFFYTDIDDLLHLYRKLSFHFHLRRSSLMMMRIPRLQDSFGRKSRRVYSRRAVKDPRRNRFKKSVSSMIMRNLRLLLSFAHPPPWPYESLPLFRPVPMGLLPWQFYRRWG